MKSQAQRIVCLTAYDASFASAMDTAGIDLVLVGESINQEYLARLAGKTEDLIKRKIRYVIFSPGEFGNYGKQLSEKEMLLIWKSEG